MRISTTLSALLFVAPLAAQDDPVQLGVDGFRFEWVPNWAKTPNGKDLGNTHGCMCVDAQGRIYANTDTDRAVVVFNPDGKFVKSWGKDYRGGLHGMTIAKETVGHGELREEREVLYLAHTGRGEVLKATLDGDVQWSIGYPKAAGIYDNPKHFKPTAVVVGPNGHIYVADGYGKSWVHQFDANRKYVRSFGGPGTEPGKMRTPHGLWLDTRKADKPQLIVCDRENHRLQMFDLDGNLLGIVEGMLRRPCNVYQHGQHLVVADLAGRITILDGKNELVCHLGDNPDPKKRARNGIAKKDWRDGEFLSPHSACWDADGNLYVMDWNRHGRLTKLRRVR